MLVYNTKSETGRQGVDVFDLSWEWMLVTQIAPTLPPCPQMTESAADIDL